MNTRASRKEPEKGTRWPSLVMWFLLSAVLFWPSGGVAQSTSRSDASVNPPKPRVLVLHSYHHGFSWSDNISNGIRSVFEEQAGDVELRFEFMDTRRIHTEAYFRELKGLFDVKYAGKPMDVIIASDDHAFNFMMGLGKEVFPNVPVVFCSVSGYEPSMRENRQLTGLQESIDIGATLDVALELHPETREVAIITDMTRTGRALKAKAENVFAGYESRLDFSYLEDLTIEDMKHRVAGLSDETIVFLFIFSRDKAGRVFSHEHNLRILVQHCNVPIYAVWEFYLGHGIVGGMLTSGEAEGRMAAEMALRILGGEDASDISLEKSPTQYMFDYRQLERFRIKEGQLPEDRILINKPFSLYMEYQHLFWGVVSTIVLLLFLVAMLAGHILFRRRAEVALRESEERHRDLVENINDVIYATDEEGVITYISPVVERVLGYSPSEVLGKSYAEFIHDDDGPHVARQFQQVMSGIVEPMEYRLVAKSGEIRWVRTSSRGIVEGDRITGLRGVLRDVTERKRAEEALGQSEERLRSLFETTVSVIICLSPDHRILEFNAEAERLYGYKREEVLGKDYLELFVPEPDRDLVAADIEKVLAGEPTRGFENRVWAGDGSERILTWNVSRLIDSQGQSAGIIAVGLDFTKSKQAEEALREREATLRSIFRAAPTGVGLVSNRILKRVNERICEMIGYSEEELVGQSARILYPTDEDFEYVGKEKYAQIRDRGTGTVETRWQRRDGEVIDVLLSSTPLDPNNLSAGVTFTALDITEEKQAEEALRESEARYRTLMEQIPAITYTAALDEASTTLYISPQIEEMTGFTQAEYKSNPDIWRKQLHPQDRERVLAEVAEAHQRGQSFASEYRMMARDGSPLWIHDEAVVVRDVEGKPFCLQGVMFNISERKRVEEALRESEEKYRRLYDNAADLIVVADSEGNFMDVNRRFEEESGYSRDEVQGKNIFTSGIIAKASTPKASFSFKELLQGKEWQHLEVDGVTKDGNTVPYEVKAVPIKKDGEVQAVQATLRNISERKEAEEVLRTEKEKFQILVEESPLAVSLIGHEGEYKYINPEFVEMFGYTLEDVPNGRAWFTEAYPDPGYRDEVISAWIGDMKNTKASEARPRIFDVTCKDGSRKVVNFRPVTMRNGDQLVIYEDITEQRRLERRLRQAQKMEAIGTLAGGIAHDFNNILTPIIVQTEVAMQLLPEQSPVQHNLKEVTKAGHRARDLVRQILTFGRQSEQQRLPLRVSPVLKETMKLLRSSLPTTIEMRQSMNAASDVALTDPTEIHQVLMNLCTNAAHAMREKGGVLEVGLVDVEIGVEDAIRWPELKPGSYLRLSVSDTGEGIDRVDRERIFDPFFTTKSREEGTGMGLAVVHRIVKSYGGTITVESEPGKGTTFYVFLPGAGREATGPTKPAGPVPTGNERILLVDDEQTVVETVRLMLEHLGYEVAGKTSSVDALEAFQADPDRFDLVITDQTMPKMTGKELAQRLASIRADLPIVLFTGFGDGITEQEARAVGISAHLMKPVVMDDMARTIRKLMDKAGSHEKVV